MASSAKSDSTDLHLQRGDCESNTVFLFCLLQESLPQSSPYRLAVAVSGGVDSMSMLQATVSLYQRMRLPLRDLYAFHVHHGLQTMADDWLEFVSDFCKVHGIGFVSKKLDPYTRGQAQSLEDWARKGRYQALTDMAREMGVGYIWLAQHQDDQLETHVLQSQRGAGVRGLSAMPKQFVKNGMVWTRPWLSVPKSIILEYADEQSISYCEDPSNFDERFARNALRAQWRAIPLDPIQRYELLTAIRSAQRQHELEQQWAKTELARYQADFKPEIGELSRLQGLNDGVFKQYTDEQQRILLRQWLADHQIAMPSRAALAELIKQLTSKRVDQHMCWLHPQGYGIALFQNQWVLARVLPKGQWFISPEIQLMMDQQGYQIQTRVGGERVKLHPKRPTFTLKEAYQMAGVPPMLRHQLPLLYKEGQLVYVVGVGKVI